jgi:hypothetical protein
MRTVHEIESDIRRLAPDEQRRIQRFLDDLIEDDLEFTDEFEAQIRQSEAELKSGVIPRTRKV